MEGHTEQIPFDFDMHSEAGESMWTARWDPELSLMAARTLLIV